MKKLIPVIVLLFAAAAFGQTTRDKGIETRYDKFKDETTVSLSEFVRPGVFEALFSYDGKAISKDAEHFYLYFDGDCSSFCFDDAALIMMIDGERVHAGVDKGLGDSAVFAVGRDTIAKIANAKLVEYQVGRFEGKWEAKTIAKFKTLLDLGTVK